jgi:exopolysaccharide biosynthesis polyprenyl glycosylphosphotransferase
MVTNSKWESSLLFIGDILFFVLALWLTLVIRYLEFPDFLIFYNHLAPFSVLFIVWVATYFIAGLYDKHTVIFKSKLPSLILNAQIANIVLAALFFFLIPVFGITPKTILVIYLITSFVFIVVWRLSVYPLLGVRRRQPAVLIGEGKTVGELEGEINNNSRYGFKFTLTIDLTKNINPNDLQQKVLTHITGKGVPIIVCNVKSDKLEPLLPLLYNISFMNMPVQFVDINAVYEDIFDRVPLLHIHYDWFLENVSVLPHRIYSFFKRFIDIVSSLFLCVMSLVIYPFVTLAIALDDGGPTFLVQERVGQFNQPIHVYKFRTMTGDDKGHDVMKSENTVTRVGRFLRSSRIDELPQLWNVLKGDLSLIGPRPELPALSQYYSEKIPHYNTRYLVQPGLSGWAQIHHDQHPHHGSDVAETRVKLSYDLYYIKNRSPLLDLHIALKTIKTLLSRSGV